jgi:hypothetical protein
VIIPFTILIPLDFIRYFHIIHDARVLDFGPFGPTPLQTAIIASQEGLTWLYWSEADNEFKKYRLHEGEVSEKRQTQYPFYAAISGLNGKISNVKKIVQRFF